MNEHSPWPALAAGAGDELAAHLLAVHHAAVGRSTDARLWRAVARMMGFAAERHLPLPVRGTTELALGFARTWDRTLQSFLQHPHLPRELAAHRPPPDPPPGRHALPAGPHPWSAKIAHHRAPRVIPPRGGVRAGRGRHGSARA